MNTKINIPKDRDDLINAAVETDDGAVAAGNPKISSPPDWRIGLSVRPKGGVDLIDNKRGVVIDVLPSGTGGIKDRDGVLKIRLSCGMVVIRGSKDWESC